VDEQLQNQTIKPLAELYGKGTGLENADTSDPRMLALLMPIEESFVNAYAENPSLTDGAVLGALDRLCMSPEGPTGHDVLAAKVQLMLGITLSVNDFSRQDVRHALRKVKQSVVRHNKLGGTRGYLNFIAKTVGGR